MSGRSPDSPDTPNVSLRNSGEKGAPGAIGGGVSAKRKRDAWIRFQSEQTGLPPEQIPVVHAGGLSRPLYTPTSWEPVNQLSDSDVEIVAEQVVIHETDLEGAFSLSAPVSRELGVCDQSFWLRSQRAVHHLQLQHLLRHQGQFLLKHRNRVQHLHRHQGQFFQ